MDHLRRLESPFRVSLMVSAVPREPAARAQQRSVAEPSYEKRNSSLCHSTDLKDRSRSEQSSNRDSPTCFVIPSEATRPNRGICIWFFLELKEGNKRSHPAHLHLQLLMWRGRPPPRLHLQLLMWRGRPRPRLPLQLQLHCTCLCGTGVSPVFNNRSIQVAPGSPPDPNQRMNRCENDPIPLERCVHSQTAPSLPTTCSP